MEAGVGAERIAVDLSPIYLGLRRVAAVVAAPDVEPDDLVLEAVTRVLATGQWRKIHDLRAYVLRTIVDAAPNVRAAVVDLAPDRTAEVTLVATLPSELNHADPATRGLLYLVEVEDYLVDEAATLIGCSHEDAERRLARVRPPPTRESLERLATRGEVRGAEAITEAALVAAAERRCKPDSRSRHPRWRVAAAAALAVALLIAILAVRQRDKGATSAEPTSTTAPVAPVVRGAPATFASTSYGWVFDEGLVRDIFDNHPVALFPMKAANYAPVRVEGGFVAVLADRSLWFAKQESAESVQLDTLVEGVAASPGGSAIAYSTVAPDGRSATVKLVDVSSRSVLSQVPLDRFARVVGISNPEVLLDTGDANGSAAALWDPNDPTRVVYLDAFSTVGGVGRNVAVLHQGDGACPALVTVRNDAIQPLRNVDLAAGDDGCDPRRWDFDSSGAIVAGFGSVGAPASLRVSVNRFPVAIGSAPLVAGAWVDPENMAVIDERGELLKCDVSARCSTVRLVDPSATQGTLWLIPPRRDVANDRTG